LSLPLFQDEMAPRSRPIRMSNRPSLSYLICSAPRTGSTLLAQALNNTGRAGHPHEFFDIHDPNERFWIDNLAIANDAEYFDKVLAAGTTPNGIFGMKLFWHQSPALIAKLRAVPALANAPAEASFHELLKSKLGAAPLYIWLRRQDKLAQAISYLRASRTGVWRSTDAPASAGRRDAELAFDFDLIAQYLRVVNQFDLRWDAFFRENRLEVLLIGYESFIASYEATIFSVLDFLDLPSDGLSLASPILQRQADARTLEWRHRFLELSKERGLSRQP
jgi:trehalose 2-sulfotransferase